jgi:pyruvate,water dikinase
MGEPQDVEWAWQDGVFFLLQTRPIAAIPQPEQLLDQAWTRGGYAEWLPEIPSPLAGSLLERSQHQASLFFKEIGLAVDGLGSYEKLILGRPYLNLSFLRRVIAQVGLHPDSFLQTIGYTKPVAIAGLFSVDWGAAWKKRRVYWMALKRVLSIRQQLKELQVLVDDVTNVLADTNLEAPSATLLGQLRQHDRLYSEFFAANLKLTVSIALIVGIGGRLIAPLAKAPTAVINALALKGLKTSQDELNQDLLTLSRLARDDQQTQEYLLAAPDDFQGYVQDSTIPAEFKRSFEAFLIRYGHRAAYEADVGWPRYQDDPTDLLRVVKQYVKNEPPPSNGGAAITWQTLTTPPRGIDRLLPWRRWLAKPFIGTLRRLFLMRDELTSTIARALAACRRWDLALAREWVDRGWLEQVDDIFWLTMQEIERTLMVGGGVAITLSSTVRARKDTYQTYANTEMPFNLRESQIPSIQLGIGLSSETPSDVTVGLPVSPGQARGTVVVVHHPDEVTDLGDDAILVMPSTDPAWLALLHRASGLVVETGGLLSHGSVIAREYGLPAVANIPEATKQFHTGDKVLVDGSTGVVQLLELGGIK